MNVILRYRGRDVTEADVENIRSLILEHPGESRRRLSKVLCAAWNWVQANGQPCDMVCRGLMLELHRAGRIELPPVRQVSPNNVVLRRRRERVEIDATGLETSLDAVRPLEIRQVRRTSEERLFDSLIEEHHYLGYVRPVGEHLKHLVWSQGRPIACMAWSSAPRHLGPRDRFIGWDPSTRRRNIRFVAYNTRFLILPWIRVRHLASHVLSRVARVVSDDWVRVYGHPIYYLETFVEPERFRGTCYRAANWVALGLTTGRGKDAPTKAPTRSKKEVLGLPLRLDFRELLGAAR
jgi:hypothetical protein